MDLNLTEFKKGGANVTGFQLMNYTDLAVSRMIQEWLEFDSKDLKSPKRRLKVQRGRSHQSMLFMMDFKTLKVQTLLERL